MDPYIILISSGQGGVGGVLANWLKTGTSGSGTPYRALNTKQVLNEPTV